MLLLYASCARVETFRQNPLNNKRKFCISVSHNKCSTKRLRSPLFMQASFTKFNRRFCSTLLTSSNAQIQVERSSISLAFKELSAFLFFFGRAVLALAVDVLLFVVSVFAAAAFPFARFEILSSSLLLVEDVLKSAKKCHRNPNFHFLHWMNFPRFPPLLCLYHCRSRQRRSVVRDLLIASL